MLRDYISNQRSLKNRPGLIFLLIGTFWNLLCLVRRRNPFPIFRFFRANRVPIELSSELKVNSLRIELLFVATGSDIEMLPYSITCAEKALLNYIHPIQVSVIVPSSSVSICKEKLRDFKNLRVIDEDTMLAEESRAALKMSFNNRYGWSLQQLLKVKFVLDSEYDAVLIVDADTLLLQGRPWLNENSMQILTPSDEFNRSYYDFMFDFGLSSRNPKYTFVSHHMVMQPKFLRELLESAGWKDVDAIVDALVNYPFEDLVSPFSLDYEAYAQFMWNFKRDHIKIYKWSNLAVPRSSNLDEQIPSLLKIYDGEFSSISLHAYL